MISSKAHIKIELPVMESFFTIQGEGFHQGKAAWFIRLGGCDVGCHWCDTMDSWKLQGHPVRQIEDLISEGKKGSCEIAVVTGGEPLMHDLDILTEELRKAGYKTHIETSGAYPLSGKWDWISFSPKKFKKPRPEVAMYANELKIIVYNKSDLDWAEQWAQEVSENCILYLQPEWSRREEMIPVIVAYLQQNPQWKVSLQMHKYLNIP